MSAQTSGMTNMQPRAYTLAVIVFAQFAGTSLWFAGNAILPDLQLALNLPPATLGWLTSAVQAGFITGTFIFATLSLADRFPAHALFLICSLAAAAVNLLITLEPSLTLLLICRFLTGFFLAGIYPVGMKLAAAWFPQAIGRAIGYLVGALVLGTAFPHLIRALGTQLDWTHVLLAVSLLACCGGIALFVLTGDPRAAHNPAQFSPAAVLRAFQKPAFRRAAFGYFGHMWELYAFWAFVPVFIASKLSPQANISLWSFAIIAIGSIGCVIAGRASLKVGSAKPALIALTISGICCLLSPLAFQLPLPFFMAFMLLWGLSVIADSAQFSALTAKHAPAAYVGSALTMTTCIGFAISIISIELLNRAPISPHYLMLLLLPGPIFGLLSAAKSWR